jgi:predicted HicB family RNase H-like nuclease
MKKLSNYSQKKVSKSKDDEIRALKRKLEDLEGIKDFQQDLIAEFEKVTGEELSKKYLPEWLSNEIQRKKKKLK